MLFGNFHKKLQKWGRDWFILAVSFLAAVMVWALLKLSASYSALYHYKIELVVPQMEGREFSSLSEGMAVVRGQSSGFTILRQRYSARVNKNILRFSVNKNILHKVQGSDERFYVIASTLKDNISAKMAEQITMDVLSTDTLFFTFKKTAYKKVPVAVKSALSYKTQYMPFEPLRTKPDSIEIHGGAEVLEGIEYVETELIKKKKLHQSFQGTTLLEPIKGVEFSESEVYYSQRIGRYFESTITAPVSVKNVPSDVFMLLNPNDVSVTYREDYNVKREYSATDFHLFADYDMVASSVSGMARVQISDPPQGVYDVKIVPDLIDVTILRER